MTTNSGGLSCSLGCWLLAAGVGFLTAVLLLILGNTGWIGSVFLGGIAFVLLGLLFNWLFCAPLPKLGEVKPGDAYASRAASHGSAGHGAATAAGGGTSAGGAGAGAGGSASAGAGSAGAGAGGSASAGAGSAGAGAGGSTSAGAGSAGTGAGGGTSAGAGGAGAGAGGSASAGAGSAGAGAGGGTSSGTSGAAAAGASAAGTVAASAAPAVKPSATLKGEQELSGRKGDWKYEADGKSAKATASKAAALGEDGIDRDGDGVVEGKNEGRRPEALSGPRGGTADDLKRIKGIGPKLEQLCFKLGFYHFDQIAAWKADEVAWVDANLEGFKGRVTRDEWVRQAGLLASGGETEFSKRVDDGDVY